MTLDAQAKLLKQLDFSDVKQQIDELKQWLEETTTTDESKIHFLKQEITTNKYVINNNSIANKMLEEISILA